MKNKPKIDILIPCNNDCEKAEKLKGKIESITHRRNKIRIIHNGCKGKIGNGNFQFKNKARAINKTIKNIKSEYVICIDADMRISPFCIKAFENAIRKGREIGTSIIFFENDEREWNQIVLKPEFNGACWFMKTEILRKYPIPEDIFCEDTAYIHLLQKSGIGTNIITDAIAYTNNVNDSFKKTFRRWVRYDTGAIQLAAKKISFKYIGNVITLPTITTIGIFLCILTNGITRILGGLMIGMFVYFSFDEFLREKWRGKWYENIILTLSPRFIAILLFITKKKVW